MLLHAHSFPDTGLHGRFLRKDDRLPPRALLHRRQLLQPAVDLGHRALPVIAVVQLQVGVQPATACRGVVQIVPVRRLLRMTRCWHGRALGSFRFFVAAAAGSFTTRRELTKNLRRYVPEEVRYGEQGTAGYARS